MSRKSKKTAEAPAPPITRADIEAKLSELRGEVDERTEAAKVPALAVVAGATMLALIVAFWLGKRRGKKRQLVLEIRRI